MLFVLRTTSMNKWNEVRCFLKIWSFITKAYFPDLVHTMVILRVKTYITTTTTKTTTDWLTEQISFSFIIIKKKLIGLHLIVLHFLLKQIFIWVISTVRGKNQEKAFISDCVKQYTSGIHCLKRIHNSPRLAIWKSRVHLPSYNSLKKKIAQKSIEPLSQFNKHLFFHDCPSLKSPLW